MAKARKNATSSSAGAVPGVGDSEVLRARPRPKRARKSAPRDSPSQRSSAFRGVTRHRWTGRFEAHLWDKNTWNESQSQSKKKKGRQVYLGAYDGEEAAARAYDLAALKYWGHDTVLNFPLSTYDEELKEMEGQSREEYIGSLRRKSSGFSRGVSKYRGVARHHHNGKWEARIGRVFGNKYLYLGTFATQEEAAMAYDVAAIEHRGLTAVTNFDISRYIEWHHRCLLAGAEVDNEIPSNQRIDGNMTQHPTNIDLDEEAIATTIFHDDEQEDKQIAKQRRPTTTPSSTTTSALGLLLQSPKFKEMIELAMTSSGGSGNGSTDSSSLPLLSSLPSPPPPIQQMAECSSITSPMGCTFPDDVQTFFDFDECGLGYAEVDTFLFGDLGAYAAPMFQCELDV